MSENRIRSKGYMKYLVIFMGLIALVDQYLSMIETSVIPFIVADFPSIGLSGFLFWQGIFGFMAFFVFIISWFADNWGRKIGILILLLIMSLSALLIGLVGTSSFWVFIILYAILILGTNVNLWTIPISEESPPKSRAFNGSMAFLIGLIPIYAFLGEPIAESIGWQWAYGIMGIFGLVLIIPWYFMKETKRWETNREEIKQSAGSYRDQIKLINKNEWKFVVIAGIIYICWNTAFKMATSTVKFYFEDVLLSTGFDLFLILGGLGTIVGALTIGIIMEKFGRIVAFIYSSVGAAVCYIGMALLGSGIFMILVYYFMACFLGFLLVYITEMFSTKIRATATGICLTLSRVGYVIGPLLASLILPVEATPSALGNFQLLYILAAIIAAIPLISLFFNKYESKGKTLENIAEEKAE
ncbi:MAG: MFS transporter [archaeon]|nr:MFS transporter [archaeon]